ncbi:MAG: hypothetical protein K6F76_03085 [Clostridiales bacterium]|nr:hypothetical protein [Clostridiales bacterium]
MNNEIYYTDLNRIINSLLQLRLKGISIAKGIIGETLTNDDLFFCTSLDRCLRLTDGIIILLKERNLTCAGALLRLQMDNCMRTYAAFIAKDRSKVIDCIIDGMPINKQRDNMGNQMTDGYLKTAISQYDTVFAQVYNQASGFIHLSEKAFYQIVTDVNDGKIAFQIGHDLPEKRNKTLLECAKAFHHFVELHYKMLAAVVDSKTRFDQEHQGDE